MNLQYYDILWEIITLSLDPQSINDAIHVFAKGTFFDILMILSDL